MRRRWFNFCHYSHHLSANTAQTPGTKPQKYSRLDYIMSITASVRLCEWKVTSSPKATTKNPMLSSPPECDNQQSEHKFTWPLDLSMTQVRGGSFCERNWFYALLNLLVPSCIRQSWAFSNSSSYYLRTYYPHDICSKGLLFVFERTNSNSTERRWKVINQPTEPMLATLTGKCVFIIVTLIRPGWTNFEQEHTLWHFLHCGLISPLNFR